MTPPAFAGLSVEQFSFMCRAASLPASSVGLIELPYFGRRIKLAGDRSFEDWTVAVYNDETFDLRNALEKWQTAIASHTTETGAQRVLAATSSPNSYTGKALIQQFAKDNATSPIKQYELVNVWPQQISSIDLGWDQVDRIEEFNVVFSFDYFKTKDGNVI